MYLSPDMQLTLTLNNHAFSVNIGFVVERKVPQGEQQAFRIKYMAL